MPLLSNYRMHDVSYDFIARREASALRGKRPKAIAIFCFVLVSCWAAFCQQPSQPPNHKPPSSQPSGQGDIGIQVQPAAPPAEKKITSEEAKQLFASIDDTLSWLGKDTGYPIKQKVKGDLVSREQVAKYVETKLNEDEDAKRLQRSEIVLKKFGLLPRDFDLHSFLVQLLKEQVAGYYDVKTKSMYLLDWLEPDSQKPVLAHELTHALQDQNFGLEAWESPKAPKGSDKEEYSYDEDEASTARSAVAEGQGMVTLVDYMLRDTGHTLAESPKVAEMMRKAMTSNDDFPLLQHAPLMIRESLVFPYGDGLSFEAALLEKSKDTAFSGAFRRPPQDTHEVLDVAAYLNPHPVHWLMLPDLKRELGSSYEKYDVGSIGQLDTKIFVEQYADKDTADDLAKAWRGGAYYAARNKDPKVTGTAKISLLYLSRWDSDADADEFAKIYADYVPQRYGKASRGADREGGRVSYSLETEEGPIHVERVPGAEVLVVEGFDTNVAAKLREKVLLANPTRSVQVQLHSLMSPLRTSAVLGDAVERVVAKEVVDAATRNRNDAVGQRRFGLSPMADR